MTPAPVSPTRLARARSALALLLYALTGACLVLGALALLFGRLHVELAGVSVSVGSWRILRVPCVAVIAAYLVDHGREARLDRWRAAVLARRRGLALWALAAVAAYLVWFKVAQHLGFFTNGWDLTEFESALHNTLRGDFMLAFGIERSLFGDHFEPLLLGLLPFYALVPSPLTLLVLQGLAVAAACVPLYAIGRASAASVGSSVLLVGLFLTSAYLWRGFSFDFHIELFAPLFMFAAWLAFLKARWGWLYAALVGALTVKEDMGLALIALSVLMVLRRRSDWRHALATCALGVAWAVIAFEWVIPAFDPGLVGRQYYAGRYAHLGATHREMIVALLDPRYLAGLLTGEPVRKFLASMNYLPLLDPGLCVAMAPALVLHLASNFKDQLLLDVYYPLPAFCVALAGLPLALSRLGRVHPRLGQAVMLLAIGFNQAVRWPAALEPRAAVGRELLAAVPKGARVAAQDALLPQLEPSRTVWIFPHEGVDWVLLDLERDHFPIGDEEYVQRVEALLGGADFGVVAWREGFLFLRRGAAPEQNAGVLEALRRRFGR